MAESITPGDNAGVRQRDRTVGGATDSHAPADVPTGPFGLTIEEARARARTRFKERLQNNEKIGDCACEDDEGAGPTAGDEPARPVVGVRFRDSGRTYYFDARGLSLAVGDWVVVESSRGREAGRVIIAPHQVRLSRLQGDLRPIHRRLNDEDVTRMESLRRGSADAVKTFKTKIREFNLPIKAIAADYNFDGSVLALSYSASDKVELRDLAKSLAQSLGCRVELKQVGPRDEARLLGGLGRCGRTLCCSSWLPVYPEISMSMAKNQELSLNPQKVSGVCGRLLCCLSYETEQYKRMKSTMPRLGQTVETPQGPGFVVSLQILKELITVRLADSNTDVVFPSAELGFKRPEPAPAPVAPAPAIEPGDGDGETPPASGAAGSRRRRRRKRPAAAGAPTPGSGDI
jgi:cell fate regulator YaaT (PSP1 superfamily)